MDDFLKVNQAHWDELVPIHAHSRFYDLDGFRAGKLTLMPLEREELGDVVGRSLLHLQCHFGLDTLSWARLGARVTGVDFSEPAIALARSLSEEQGLEARFICSNIYDLPAILSGQFDIVFTSYGVLCWLPDLPRWAQVVAHFMNPHAVFYMVEFHPFAGVFYSEPDATELQVTEPYFHSSEPLRWESDGSYADTSARLHHRVTYQWVHSLSDVLNALIAAGLRIRFLHEFPFAAYAMFPFMEQGGDGWWRLKERRDAIPLMFSLKATW